jgi:hypothetical protein
MQTKLTLRLEEKLIRRAKRYARRSGRSVSQLVADYFALLEQDDPARQEPVPPTVTALRGLLRGSTVDEADYRQHLLERHG